MYHACMMKFMEQRTSLIFLLNFTRYFATQILSGDLYNL